MKIYSGFIQLNKNRKIIDIFGIWLMFQGMKCAMLEMLLAIVIRLYEVKYEN